MSDAWLHLLLTSQSDFGVGSLPFLYTDSHTSRPGFVSWVIPPSVAVFTLICPLSSHRLAPGQLSVPIKLSTYYFFFIDSLRKIYLCIGFVMA